MPELPDVEIFRRHLSATSLHRPIAKTSIDKPRLARDVSVQLLQRRLKDQQFETTQRHGKYLFVELSSGDWLVLHFGMTGRLQFVKPGEEFPQYTAAVFHFQDETALAYDCRRLLGRISLTEDLDEFRQQHDLGPDALELSKQEFVELLGQKRGAVKNALMDQSTLAGIGNVYSDEILFQLQWHPRKEMASLSKEELGELYRAAQRVLKTAIRHHAQPREMPRDYLLPHRATEGDGDTQCPRCGGGLEKLEVSSRHAVYCPNCQPP